MNFEYLGHTADLRAVVSGRSTAEIFDAACALLRDALIGASSVRARSARQVRLASAVPEERFFQFVRELVFLYDTESFLPASAESEDWASGPIRVRGETFDPSRHQSERQIKALTRHDYLFEHGPNGYRAVLLFDL